MPHAMEHPSEQDLALFAAGDLGFRLRRKVARHSAACTRCRADIRAFQTTRVQLQQAAEELPPGTNWAALSEEMAGNIRVGLAAGECIEGFEKTFRCVKPRLGSHAALVLGAATLVVLLSLWVSVPRAQLDHLASALQSVRWQRIGATFRAPLTGQDRVVLEATRSAIEVKTNGRALSLLSPPSAGVTVTMTTQGSAGARYIDSDTGQVTINRVYYAQ